MASNISVVMIVKNGALTIKNSLESLIGFDDVVVYDNGSEDETANIASKFSNVNFIQGEFIGFGETKNKAASYAKHEWILILDSDEVVDSNLFKTLKNTDLDNNSVYLLNFHAFYKEIQIKHCGWNNQKIKRLYNKTKTKFNSNYVHENIITDKMNTVELNGGNILHYSYHSISDFIKKADRYSTLFAQNNVGKKTSSPAKALFNGIFSFIKTYFFKRGFLDGYAGLVIAFSHMATNFYKYIKLYELNHEAKK
ncbi:glycosyltransferase family 2 protein [Sulfurimonas sp.]|uniref:glycosyltransferase family 2 protein n=1 Tax=Sulfurimonas sp. TaxID=2022749 RepID=UPI0025DC5584|nr:glycosyltransferase family 2 protein [Sulfurimonas sp.]MDD5156436.1 glycosyltransferase family 2 protein [Sulfurimonas sp.]